MRITPKRGLAAAAGLLAVAGAIVVLPGTAGAQAEPTLTVTPSTIQVGESADFIATGCTDSEIPQEQLKVFFTFLDAVSDPVDTDVDGTAVLNTGEAPEAVAGQSFTVSATCTNVIDENQSEVLFEYDPVVLTVAQSTSPSTELPTTEPPAAEAATVTPAFTG